jgi:RHS repeat-associated protein
MDYKKIIALAVFSLNLNSAIATCLQNGADPELCETDEIIFLSGEASTVAAKATELGSPVKIYEYLRNNAEYKIYNGSQSVSLNTLLNMRGNNVDLATTLIAMLRSQGIRSRYVNGIIKLKKSELANWLGVMNEDLAINISGKYLQAPTEAEQGYITIKHVWVEALLAYDNYRVGNTLSTPICTAENNSCKWVSLDASFKQKQYNNTYRLALSNLGFDYNAYYNAENPTSPNYKNGLKNKNPAEIFEVEALKNLRTNYPGITLEDVAGNGKVIKDESGLLPASLPYEVITIYERPNSIDEHDLASVDIFDWSKYISIKIKPEWCNAEFDLLPISMWEKVAKLSTRNLSISWKDIANTKNLVIQLDNDILNSITDAEIYNTLSLQDPACTAPITAGLAYTMSVIVDTPYGSESTTHYTLTLGGHQSIVLGSESSGWSQVKRAYQRLLTTSIQYPIVIGNNSIAYIDENKNGIYDTGDTSFSTHPTAKDALTKDMLFAARTLYTARLRETKERHSKLAGLITPLFFTQGLVSTLEAVAYIGTTPFEIIPSGLLIDVRNSVLDNYEIDKPNSISNSGFEFNGFIGSALEHEVWQELVGLDAISTVHGLQLALAQGKTLLEIDSNIPASLNLLNGLDSTGAADALRPSFIQQIRDDISSISATERIKYTITNKLIQDDNYLINIFFKQKYDNNQLNTQTFGISNHSALLGGGAYVDFWIDFGDIGDTDVFEIDLPELDFDTDIDLPDLDFEVGLDFDIFNQNILDPYLNHDPLITLDTLDPISTVTGNMYHDETDLMIKGRGLNYTFTRTYNSLNIDNSDNLPLSKGWVHSYNMKLVSNDFGKYPSAPGTIAPENINGTTSSITYTNERGGEVNYLIDDINSTWAISSPKMHFDNLEFNFPLSSPINTTGTYTLTFRNGTKYIFEGGDLRVVGNTARIARIEDPYGNQLIMGYTNNKLTSVTDNLAITGRTGIALSYYPVGHPAAGKLYRVTDWTGRNWTYNYTDGQLTSVADPLSNSMSYTYAEGTNLLKDIIHPEDRDGTKKTMTFSYYDNDRAYSYIDQLSNEESLTYDLFRNRTRITNPRGFITEHNYNSRGALTKLVKADNGILLFENNEDGLRYIKHNALGYATSYSYNNARTLDGAATDSYGQVTREQDALDNTIDISYGIYDQVTELKNKNNIRKLSEYYATTNPTTGAVKGKLHRIVMPQARVNGTAQTNVVISDYQYNADGTIKHIEEMIDPATPLRKRITDFIYNYMPTGFTVLKTITGTTSGRAISTKKTYDSLWRLKSSTLYRRASATNATTRAITTQYEYDELNRQTKITDPLGNIIESIYDKNGEITQIIKRFKLTGSSDRTIHNNCTIDIAYPNFHSCTVTTNTYGKTDLLKKKIDINGNEVNYEYDSVGNTTKITNPLGHSLNNEYDANNRLIKITNENGHSFETNYDLAGHVSSTIDGNNNATTFKYNAIGRKIETTTAEGRTTRIDEYDGNGNVTKMRDANAIAGTQTVNSQGASLYKQYDEFNRVISETNANNETTTYTYNLLGKLTSISDDLTHITQFIFDDMGKLIQKTDPTIETPTDKVHSYTYDEAGNRLTSTDRNGETIRTTYDALNRATLVEYLNDGTTQTATYNQYSELSTIANSNVTYSYIYDNQHRMTRKTDSRTGKFLNWAYDAAGNMVLKTDYQGQLTQYSYDSTNRLVAMKNNAYLQASYHYDAAGRLLSRILSNGASTIYNYDKDGFKTKVIQRSADNTVIDERNYGHDNIGNITSVAVGGGETTSYTYDPAYRLLTVDSNNDTSDQNYTYDSVGNRLTMTKNGTSYHYIYNNKGNRLDEIRYNSAAGSLLNSYDYDDNGSRITRRDGTGSTIESNTYNQKQLITQQTANSRTFDFAYDPNSYRIVKADSSLISNYLLEGEHLEATYDENNQLKASYLRGVVVDEIINGFERSVNGQLINQSYHHDQVNSIVATTDHNGSTTHTKTYSPFGLSLNTTDTGNNISVDQLISGNGQIYNGTSWYYTTGTSWQIFNDTWQPTNPPSADILDDSKATFLAAMPTATNTLIQLELGFSGAAINSSGSDLELFFLWDQSDNAADITINGTNQNLTFQKAYNTDGSQVSVDNVIWIGELRQNILLMSSEIDLSDFGLAPGERLSGSININLNATGNGPVALSSVVLKNNTSTLAYTGRELDNESGLYYYRARYYDPMAGRFLSEDPLGFKAGINFYAYVGNNPLNFNDPSGLRTYIVHGTFAQDATYDDVGSDFNNAVSATFGEQAIPFNWSGGNSQAARSEGAAALFNAIEVNPLAYGETLNIVAHSHGGNLVKEFSNLDNAPTIDNLVTLGTPQRSDYSINSSNVENHINVSAWNDAVQSHGGPYYTLLDAGFYDEGADLNLTVHANTFNPITAHSNLHTTDIWADLSANLDFQNSAPLFYPSTPGSILFGVYDTPLGTSH